MTAPVAVLYAAPHSVSSVGDPAREIEPPTSTTPLQLPVATLHCSDGSVRSPTVDDARLVRCAVAPRRGHAADASAPPYTPTATGVTDGDGDGDGVLVGVLVDTPDRDASGVLTLNAAADAEAVDARVPTIDATGDTDAATE